MVAFVTHPIYGQFRAGSIRRGAWKGYATERAGSLALRGLLEQTSDHLYDASDQVSIQVLEPEGAAATAFTAWVDEDLGRILYTGRLLEISQLSEDDGHTLRDFLRRFPASPYSDMVRMKLALSSLARGEFRRSTDLLDRFDGHGEEYLSTYRVALLSWAYAGQGLRIESERMVSKLQTPAFWPELAEILEKARARRDDGVGGR